MKTQRFVLIGAAFAVALVAGGCTTTQSAPLQKSDVHCAFLGKDCARMQPGGEGQAALRYVNSSAPWKSYKKVIVEPVTFWGSESSSVSVADQQNLTNFFYQQLRTQIGQVLPLTDTPGPGVMALQVAITDLEAATPGLRTISMIVPQARLLNTAKYAATGTYAFVGGAQVEGKLTDSMTGMVLAESADRRVGGGSLETAAQWKWGDAENGMTAMAKLAAERLKEWTSGAVTPK